MDLAVLVPSRGRPGNVERLLDACVKTCRAGTEVLWGFDSDDPHLEELCALAGANYYIMPRMGLAPWTNHLARQIPAHQAPRAIASLGDDHVPETDGWDERLLAALEMAGGGFAVPNDLRTPGFPEAVAISTPIVAALGWVAPTWSHHWCIDDAWNALALEAGAYLYLPDVVVAHHHPENKVPGYRAESDATYGEAAWSWERDRRAFIKWKTLIEADGWTGLQRDAATVYGALG